MKKIPERFLWASEQLNVSPDDKILEIGCGSGVLLEVLSGELKEGHILGIDRSVGLTANARSRNGKAIEKGLVAVETIDLEHFKTEERFDKIVAFNVNVFLQGSSVSLSKLKALLKPGGRLFIFYQFPYRVDLKAAEPIAERLKENGFHVEDMVLQDAELPSIMIIASQVIVKTP